MQDINSEIISRLSSRKFIVALFSMLSASLLCWYQHIDGGVYSAVVIATAGAYLAANVAQKTLTKSSS